jgi:hypothetical protein
MMSSCGKVYGVDEEELLVPFKGLLVVGVGGGVMGISALGVYKIQ